MTVTTQTHIERAHDILRQARGNPLEAIFAPKTVAVIGATEKGGSVGRAVVENLLRSTEASPHLDGAFSHTPSLSPSELPVEVSAQAGGEGVGARLSEGKLGARSSIGPSPSASRKVFLVNPNQPILFGHRTFPNIAAVPEKVDLAVIVTPAPTVPGIIRDCVQAGVLGAIIISAGFKECGGRGAELEQQILTEARRGRIRIIGPNCLGVMTPHLGLNATFAAALARPGKVAFISQSGALCTAILDWSLRENVGFSAFVSVGSMLDVGWGDLIYYLGDDPHTRSIVIYMESVGQARSFLSAAREVALTKPIIVIKVGHTEAAAKAAASHTGSLTGSDEVLDAAFRRAGVLRVNTIEELFDMAEVLAKQPRPSGPRLAIVTNAGGPGALATDMLVSSGGQLAQLTESTCAALEALLPPHWSHSNPIDILGDAGPERYAKSVELAAKDPNVDGLLVILTPQAMTNATATAEHLKPLAKLAGKPLLASWMGGPAVDAGEAILNCASIPTFKYADRAARAFGLMWRYTENLRSLYETPALGDSGALFPAAPEPGPLTPSVSLSAGERVSARTGEGKESVRQDKQSLLGAPVASIDAARKAGRAVLTEYESKQILAAYGIPTVETNIALSEDDAVAHAHSLGFPVVVKLLSETLTHKTDVGGVRLDVRNAAAVRRAWRAIEASVGEKAGRQHFLGVTVQPMVSTGGIELILGSSVDPQFGPVLLFGAGGQLVEVFKDRALGLPPLNATLARRLMEQTRIYAALRGVRGRKPVDVAKLELLLVRFSQLVIEQRCLEEIDINPLLVSSERMLALDARMLLHGPGVSEAQLPALAIRPYPAQYITEWKLKDETDATIRPIRPEDEPVMVKFHEKLSERSVYYRYFTPLRLEQRIAHERLARICFIDYDREMALVVERNDAKTGEREILGVGRLSKLHGADEAEFAITVSDQWQNQGLGTQLLKMLVQVARDEKLDRITGTILPDNREMQRVCRKVGFHVRSATPESDCAAEILLSAKHITE